MSNTESKLPDKKKNDLLKKFLNAQEYTKTLKVILEVKKKSARNVIQDSSYGGYSYDEMQSYPQIPQSAKLPSSKQISYRDRMLSNDIIYSFQSMNVNQSKDFTNKTKAKKSHHEYNNMTQSTNQLPYMKSKKSSYSQIDKSQSIPRTVTADNPIPIKNKGYDVLSMNKQKYSSDVMHESLGGMKTESFFKPKTKKSFNYSNLQEYDSQRMSAENQNSFQKLRKTHQQQVKPFYKSQKNKQEVQYNLSSLNFLKLINKVEQLESVILVYQQVVETLKKKILSLQAQNKAIKMSQIYIDSLKQEIFQEKNKNAVLRERLSSQENFIKEYQQNIIESVKKIDSFYQTEISKIAQLQKQNQFLKFILKLEIQTQNNSNPIDQQSIIQSCQQIQELLKNKIQISKSMGNFKQKFTNLMEKNKTIKI